MVAAAEQRKIRYSWEIVAYSSSSSDIQPTKFYMKKMITILIWSSLESHWQWLSIDIRLDLTAWRGIRNYFPEISNFSYFDLQPLPQNDTLFAYVLRKTSAGFPLFPNTIHRSIRPKIRECLLCILTAYGYNQPIAKVRSANENEECLSLNRIRFKNELRKKLEMRESGCFDSCDIFCFMFLLLYN